MEATKNYPRCTFASRTIRDAIAAYRELQRPDDARWDAWFREIAGAETTWKLDDDDEFFAAYDRGFVEASYRVTFASQRHDSRKDALDVHAYRYSNHHVTVVRVVRDTRGAIEHVFRVFDDAAAGVREPLPIPAPPEPPRIFIGHGQSDAWKDLKDHLSDKHGYEIEAYETGARAGHTIRDILESMVSSSSFAVLVLTADDETADGQVRARQNVIHEVGLFQGALGFKRAVLLVEEGVELASNFDGLQQIRFQHHMQETFGEVLATLRREFPDGRP